MVLKKIVNRFELEKKLYLIKREIEKKDFPPNHSILIFSDPRGGSTWLAELIASLSNSFIYWEPLHLKYCKNLQQLNFGWRQHIPENVNWPEAKMQFDEILSIKIINEWTTQKIEDHQLVSDGKFPIVKICRGNHLMPWLVNQYNFKYKPLYLVRHPLAVISSQLKQGGWDYEYNGFEIPDTPYNEDYLKHKEFLLQLKSKKEALLAIWCITNRELLREKSVNWKSIKYEEMLLKPKDVLTDIFNCWHLTIPEGIVEKIREWSSTSIDKMDFDIERQLQKWRQDFDDSELMRFQEILDYFAIKEYSSNNVLPEFFDY